MKRSEMPVSERLHKEMMNLLARYSRLRSKGEVSPDDVKLLQDISRAVYQRQGGKRKRSS